MLVRTGRQVVVFGIKHNSSCILNRKEIVFLFTSSINMTTFTILDVNPWNIPVSNIIAIVQSSYHRKPYTPHDEWLTSTASTSDPQLRRERPPCSGHLLLPSGERWSYTVGRHNYTNIYYILTLLTQKHFHSEHFSLVLMPICDRICN